MQEISTAQTTQSTVCLAHQFKLLIPSGFPNSQEQAHFCRLLEQQGAGPWGLGGFRFPDGSVLQWNQGWTVLDGASVAQQLWAKVQTPFEVYLLYSFDGSDGRERRSIAEAVFEYQPSSDHWCLRVEYEAYMDGLPAVRPRGQLLSEVGGLGELLADQGGSSRPPLSARAAWATPGLARGVGPLGPAAA